MGTTCVSVRRWQHKPHVAILRPRALTSQSSVAVTHLHTGCCSFYLPRRDGILSRDCLLRLSPGPPAHMSEHASERPLHYNSLHCRAAVVPRVICWSSGIWASLLGSYTRSQVWTSELPKTCVHTCIKIGHRRHRDELPVLMRIGWCIVCTFWQQ
jgi:hypothetical protein